jgi:hypothetical protein
MFVGIAGASLLSPTPLPIWRFVAPPRALASAESLALRLADREVMTTCDLQAKGYLAKADELLRGLNHPECGSLPSPEAGSLLCHS